MKDNFDDDCFYNAYINNRNIERINTSGKLSVFINYCERNNYYNNNKNNNHNYYQSGIIGK